MKSLVSVLVLIAAQGWAFAAAAECPELQKVRWWTSSVADVKQAVVANFKGDWDAYIARWKQQRHELQTAFDNNGSVEIKSRNLVFVGDDLKTYIAMVDQRISTLECLKREADQQIAAFDTASGGAQAAPRQEASLIEGRELSLDIAPVCQNGVPGFQVTNLGERWPHIAEVLLFRTDTDGKITQRRVRMINSQQMMFKIPEAAAEDIEEAAIFIQPTWYERKFEYDARSKC